MKNSEILQRCGWLPTDKVATVVADPFCVCFNPDFVDDMNTQELVFIAVHETIHQTKMNEMFKAALKLS